MANFSNSKNNSLVSGTGSDDYIYNSGDKVTINAGDGNDFVYIRAKSVTVDTGAGNDTVMNDSSKVTINSGAGNDLVSLSSYADKNVIIYNDGDGNDVIFGFESGDLLQITGTFSASYNSSKKEIAFKVGSTANAITLRDFTATTFQINSNTYKISGSTLKKQ